MHQRPSAKFGLTRRWLHQAAPKCGLIVLSHTVSHGAKIVSDREDALAARRGRPAHVRAETKIFGFAIFVQSSAV